jgi:hypothetical protein
LTGFDEETKTGLISWQLCQMSKKYRNEFIDKKNTIETAWKNLGV